MSPLHFFAISPKFDYEIAKLLLDNGACIKALDARNHSPLYMAIEEKNLNAVKVLFENGAKVQDCEEINKSSLLIGAISNSEDEIAELLVKNGADLEIKSHLGCTPLAFAILKKSYTVFDSLIRNGANINSRVYTFNGDLGTPLIHFAVKLIDVRFLKLLLQNGAGIEENHNGMTPLMLAVTRWSSTSESNGIHYFMIIKLLIMEYGANLPNILRRDIHSQFWLLRDAVMFRKEKFLNVLLEYFANQHLRDVRGISLLELSLQTMVTMVFKTTIYWIHDY